MAESQGRAALLGIHHLQLAIPAGSEELCRSFWGELLGMVEVEKPPGLVGRGGCWFRSQQLELHLGVEADFAPALKAHPGLVVRGLPDLAQRLEQGGYPVIWDEQLLGYDRFHSADPFGNRLEFLQPSQAD